MPPVIVVNFSERETQLINCHCQNLKSCKAVDDIRVHDREIHQIFLYRFLPPENSVSKAATLNLTGTPTCQNCA